MSKIISGLIAYVFHSSSKFSLTPSDGDSFRIYFAHHKCKFSLTPSDGDSFIITRRKRTTCWSDVKSVFSHFSIVNFQQVTLLSYSASLLRWKLHTFIKINGAHAHLMMIWNIMAKEPCEYLNHVEVMLTKKSLKIIIILMKPD